MDEAKLIRLAKKNDLDAFNQLVIAHQDQAFRVAYRILHNEPAAQDATQDAFISAFEKIHTFHGGSFKAWLLRIVTNKCYDEIRRYKSRPQQDLNPIFSGEGDEIENPDWLIDDDALPEERAAQAELNRAIQGCIDGLPPEFRAVLILIDVEGMDYKTTSSIIQSPMGTVRSRLARARERIQKCLQGFLELLPDRYRLVNESNVK
jgi:RNA polymerase sigma-70 factor (ECF subfamily)